MSTTPVTDALAAARAAKGEAVQADDVDPALLAPYLEAVDAAAAAAATRARYEHPASFGARSRTESALALALVRENTTLVPAPGEEVWAREEDG